MALSFACALTLVFVSLLVAPELRAAPEPAPAAPRMLGEPELESGNGAALLRWAPAEHDHEYEYEYELQESISADFAAPTSRYRGTLPSWYISGRLDGRTYFRVRSRGELAEGGAGRWSEWSAPQSILVEHHDLRLAVILFVLGAVVFAITATTVLLAARSSRAPR